MGLPPALAPRQFGSLLRQIRIDAGLTQETLAERASLGVRSIQGLEQCESQPRTETVRRLADALGLSGEKREHFEAAVRPTPRRNGPADPRRLRAPPVGEAWTPRTNLPLQLTSFVGREREIAEVRRLLGTTRLLTLTGSGGCGKTRLALQVGAEERESYPDGVWLVELAPLSDQDLVPAMVALALGLREVPGQSVLEILRAYLKSKDLLLVFDNCEHLLDGVARVAECLLRSCPRLKVIATSREALGLAGETSWRVPSLSLPDSSQRLPTERLLDYEAVRLFVERGKAARPDFELTERDSAAVARICNCLDGMPLALELAASRIRGLSLEQLAQRLDDRFRLFTGGSRTSLPRQQTLRATIDWSHELLSEPERVLFRRLAVFVGGFALGAAEAACGGVYESPAPATIEREDVLELLLRLVDRSVVVAEERAGEERYRLLDTIRQYAWERLLESGEGVLARDRHRDWYLELSRRAEPELHGPESITWIDRLETEHDNLRAALSWCLESEAEIGLEIVGCLLWFWDYHGHFREGDRWATELLSRSSAETLPRARALRTLVMMARGGGGRERGAELLRESVRLCRQLGDKRELGRSLCLLANIVGDGGGEVKARQLLAESVEVSREAGDASTVSDALWILGQLAYRRGDREQARQLLEESLGIAREIGYLHGTAYRLLSLGLLELPNGDRARARALLEEGLALFRDERHGYGISLALLRLGFLALYEGELSQARAQLLESLTCLQQVGAGPVADYLELAGELEARCGAHLKAVHLFGAMEASNQRGQALFRLAQVQGTYDVALATAHTALGEEAFSRAWSEGQAVTLEQAVEYALRDEG